MPGSTRGAPDRYGLSCCDRRTLCTRSAHDQKLCTFRQRSVAINLVELHQSIGVALIMLGDIPKAVACAGNVDGAWQAAAVIFAPAVKCSRVVNSRVSLIQTSMIAFTLISICLAVDGVDPEVLDSGAREQIDFLQSFW